MDISNLDLHQFMERPRGIDCQPGVSAAFIRRIPSLDNHVVADRETALAHLAATHQQCLALLGLSGRALVVAHLVHGNSIAALEPGCYPPGQETLIPETDGLISQNATGLVMGLHVADCAAIYFWDPVSRAIGLAHSGKKGTEAAIASQLIKQMTATYGTNPNDLYVELSPCIRPPHYEIDFAADIRNQCAQAGVPEKNVMDNLVCTASYPDLYYSYRREKGRTGRMLALIWQDEKAV